MGASAMFPAARLSALAQQAASGNVVLFIGAGFSLDSEGNSGARLVRRLVARLMGLCSGLLAFVTDSDERNKIKELRQSFFKVHGIHDRLDRREFVDDLVAKYYPFNDWCISAYSDLSTISLNFLVYNPSVAKELSGRITRWEAKWLKRIGGAPGGSRKKDPLSCDTQPIRTIDLVKLMRPGYGRAERGKILFLEAMGFACPEVMAGDVSAENTAVQILDSFRSRLRWRHHVMARLAREGLSPVLITTNFDLLLEGAYRLAGFTEWNSDRGTSSASGSPAIHTRHSYFARIAAPQEFSQQRDGGRVASIVKIHGCADAFRRALDDPDTDWRRFLRSIVFTFREVQNWRDDAWSRDLVYTLLRTRTVAFAGYSTADPVLHDTIRNAYEEMARRAPRVSKGTAPSCTSAPAFFLGTPGSKEFYGLEVLRAASRAAGVAAPPLTDHPNYLRFEFAGGGNFADPDDFFIWLFHLVFRQRQLEALKAELGGIVTFLLGHPVPGQEVEGVVKQFEELVKAEQDVACTWEHTVRSRRPFEATTNWTRHFHPALLRDLAIAYRTACAGRPNCRFDDLRDGYWYYPANENFGWTAWGAVVELALRKIVAMGTGIDWEKTSLCGPSNGIPLQPIDRQLVPAVLIGDAQPRRPPLKLEIVLGNLARKPGAAVGMTALAARDVVWTLDFRTLPWRPATGGTPGPQEIWQWATGNVGAKANAINSYFAVP